MIIKEKAPHPAHHYEIPRNEPSKLIKGERHKLSSDYKCPRCKTNVGEIEHGMRVICPKCSLYITRYGNGLELEGQ